MSKVREADFIRHFTENINFRDHEGTATSSCNCI